MSLQIYKIASTTVTASAGAASISFSNIPQGYTDLIVKIYARNANSAVQSYVKPEVNSNTGSIYSGKLLYGNGAVYGSTNDANMLGYVSGGTATAGAFGSIEIYFPNYTSSSNKSMSLDSVSETNGTNGYQGLVAGLISTTSPITSIQLKAVDSNVVATTFVQYSTATLYGVL